MTTKHRCNAKWRNTVNNRAFESALANIQQAGASTPTDFEGVSRTLGDLDGLLGALSTYCRGLSVQCEGVPKANDLAVDEQDGAATPEFVCNQVAIHLQAGATGIDQARTAVSVARQLFSRLRVQGP